ncbi:cell division protein FtsQ/DivIB [Thiomicrorhabdus aquaedulcis]|uniref:cell division protein FtsQ/DivIB n=1 Tax=Thiomicrorhabdus aquaedulcis TaxID=2211106 RepID=UPI000FD8A06B|nr:FtsQ-type POTRA domain-containing protein [Thiomicrorhabdus aquaedulcis]
MKKSIRIVRALLIVLVLSAIGWLVAQNSSLLFKPVKTYQISTPLVNVKEHDIDAVMQPYLGLSFWGLNLDLIQAELTRLDWVAHATVKRSWPDRVYVLIEEQKPVARWGAAGLVNDSGTVFYPRDMSLFADFVLLDGPLDKSVEMLLYLVKYQSILNTLGFTVAALKRQVDGVWRVQLLNGPELVLDANQSEASIQRFIRAYPKLSPELRKSASVYDLRYSNGFIVGNGQ